jgi:dTMP kinase
MVMIKIVAVFKNYHDKRGLMFIIFEGCDGSGKSSTMAKIASRVKEARPDFSPVMTGQPGSTPLGKHIRRLVKFPHDIDPNIQIDNLSRQLLYMVDMINYINVILKPSLLNNIPVLADRSSFISGMIYGLAEGLSYQDIKKLFDLIEPVRADRCYIFICDPAIAIARMAKDRLQNADHFDSKPIEFAHRIYELYKNILNGPVEQNMLLLKSANISDIHIIDTDDDQESIVDFISKDIIDLYDKNVA